MKPIRECAVIKDGNERIGYFIAKTDENNRDISKQLWKKLKSSEFENLVRNNQVQYLIWENGTIKCRYTPEELSVLSSRGGRTDSSFIGKAQEDYWGINTSFKKRHILAAGNRQGLACSLASIQNAGGVYMVPMYIYGDTNYAARMVNELSHMLKNDFSRCLKTNTIDISMLMLPQVYFDKLVGNLGKQYKLLFDTSTVKYVMKNGSVMSSTQNRPDPERINKLVGRLDRLTSDNEAMLGI